MLIIKDIFLYDAIFLVTKLFILVWCYFSGYQACYSCMMLFFWFSLKKDEFYNKYKNILTFFFRSTTSTTTTATEAIETQNEVIRSRSRSPNSDRGGRVKIRVRQKKRPFTTTAIPTTTFTKTLPQFAGESLALKIIVTKKLHVSSKYG